MSSYDINSKGPLSPFLWHGVQFLYIIGAISTKVGFSFIVFENELIELSWQEYKRNKKHVIINRILLLVLNSARNDEIKPMLLQSKNL